MEAVRQIKITGLGSSLFRFAVFLLAALLWGGCGDVAEGTLDQESWEAEGSAAETSTIEHALAYCRDDGSLRIISRSEWGAAPARGLRSPHNPYRITIHHTVTTNSAGAHTLSGARHQARQVQQSHFARGWSDIGYHFLVDRKGRIYRGTMEGRMGAHAGNANYGNLGIALLGSYHLSVEPSAAQRKAVATLVRHLARKYGFAINRHTVKGHREHKATACPGHQTMKYIDQMVRWANQATYSCTQGPRYAMDFDVTLGAHRDDLLRDGRSKDILDVFEGHNPRGVIWMKNNSNRRLDNVRVKLHFSDRYLRAKRYAVFKKQAGWQDWQKMDWLYARRGNPGERALQKGDTLFVGRMRPGEKRKIVVYFRAQEYSVGKPGHANIHAWLHSIDGVYGPAPRWRSEPRTNKFARRKRGRGRVDILATDEWRFDGHHRRDIEGWRNRCNRAHAHALTIKEQSDGRGALRIPITGKNQCIVSPEWTNIDAERFDELVMRIRSTQGPHRLAVRWKNNDSQRWSRSRRMVVEPSGSGFETLVIPVGAHPAWQGSIARIRIDMLEGEEPANGIERHLINKLYFQSSTTQKTSSKRESFVSKAPATIVAM